MSRYEPVIGLEVHAQLLTASKLFCACSTQFGAEPNTQVCPVCLALPGTLPVPNRHAIELGMTVGLALGCSVRASSTFARKNYFYPDLPKGYQISQYDAPLNERGALEIEVDGAKRTIGIWRAHLEEDAAKNLHGVGACSRTLVDFNRGGVPLVEIVSAPDLRSSAEAEAYLKRLREILMFVGANDGNLEEGSFRCDANVSIRPAGSDAFGTRVELKNINSFRFVRKAIDYEIARQEAVLTSGGTVVQETRTYSDAQGKTLPMRSKEEAMDYRYFPDPDLPAIRVDEADVARVKSALPELPAQKRARFQAELGLTADDAAVLGAHPALAAWFEATTAALIESSGGKLAASKAGKRAANFLQAEALRHVALDGLSAKLPASAQATAELLWLVESDAISGKIAKDVFVDMVETGKSPKQIVADKGLVQVTDTKAIDEVVQKLVQDNPANVAAYRSGKQNMLAWFVGQAMKATSGRANPKLVNEALRKLLDQAP
jgi:aspartyl-tRNA(Asn)/glutamyl-tRNA(Gln) amidotransferase subunit B